MIIGNNPCDIHTEFMGDLCPVCLMEKCEKQQVKIDALKSRVEVLRKLAEGARDILEGMGTTYAESVECCEASEKWLNQAKSDL